MSSKKIVPKKIIQKETPRLQDITLAIDNSILEGIKTEAKGQALSINAKINQILTKYVKFYKICEVKKTIFWPHEIHAELLKNVDLDVLIHQTKEAITDELQLLLAVNNKIPLTLDTVDKYCFDGILSWTGMYTWYKRWEDENGNTAFIFEHTYDIRWSKVIAETFSYLLIESLKIPPPKIELADHHFIIRVPKGSQKK